MNGLPYYKAYPRDFIEGTIGLPFELKGAYRLVLDLIYMQGGKLPDDARYISGLLGCSTRKWTVMRGSLVDANKLVPINGFLTNRRASDELDDLTKYSESQSERRRKNKDTPPDTEQADAPPVKAEPKPAPEPKEPSADAAQAVRDYNAICNAHGWPEVTTLTRSRAAACMARLKSAGGIDGWRMALDRAARSDFLSGRDNKWQNFSFDWMAKESNFTKIMEGNYDNRTRNPQAASGKAGKSGDRVFNQIAAAAGLEEASRNGRS